MSAVFSNMLGPKLSDRFSPAEIEMLKSEIVQAGEPVRFLRDGQYLNIVTGESVPTSANHLTYGRLTRETAQKIADRLGVRAEFNQN
jgi:hypothetical protein